MNAIETDESKIQKEKQKVEEKQQELEKFLLSFFDDEDKDEKIPEAEDPE